MRVASWVFCVFFLANQQLFPQLSLTFKCLLLSFQMSSPQFGKSALNLRQLSPLYPWWEGTGSLCNLLAMNQISLVFFLQWTKSVFWTLWKEILNLNMLLSQKKKKKKEGMNTGKQCVIKPIQSDNTATSNDIVCVMSVKTVSLL